MLKKIAIPLMLSGLVLAITLHAEETATKSNVTQTLPVEDIRLFTDVFHQIRANYVNEVSDKELMEYAIKGMLNGLDPHSAYLNKNDYSQIQEVTSGEFGGVGIEIILENGFMKVVSPIDDTPAKKAGIKSGDLIIKIDDHLVKGLSMDEGIDLMRGKKGSKISLTVMRENESKPIVFTMTRDIIKIQSVKSSILEKQWGYLRISQFQSQTGQDAKEHIEKMLDKSLNQLQGLIIDLRDNPGGVLQSAVDIADLFLNEGLIVYTKGRAAESQESFNAHADVYFTGKPIVVLINSGSASASEIVAGALQDHKRAVIAGTTSFGKGSVQVILELPNDRGMKLTTARYYTPSGRSIQAEGIKPDIIIQDASITLNEKQAIYKEANLTKHLENNDENKKVNKKDKTKDEKEPNPLLDDYLLYEAVNLLKAMNLAQSAKK
jgi:carboxyl-terminal processing protease